MPVVLLRASLVVAAASLPAVALASCATDNGPNAFGEEFGPNAKVDARVDDVGPVTPDAAADAPEADAADVSVPLCPGGGVAVVLAGDDASLSGALQVNGGAWSGGAIASGAAKSLPSIAPFGAGFVAVTRGPSDALQGLSVTATQLGAPAALGSATTIGAPALASSGSAAHVVFLGADNKLVHGLNAGAGWDAANEPVMPTGGTQSFGPSAPAAVPIGADLLVASDGDDGKLYVQTRSGTAWGAAAPVPGAAVYKQAPPALVATGGGAFDAVVLWVDDTTRRVSFATRDATSKAWSASAIVDALTVTDERVSVARVSGSALLLAFRGQDQKGYVAAGTLGASSLTWTAAVAIAPGGVPVDAPPSVAKGTCGDDAILAFASGAQVKATRLRQGAWSMPEPVTGASGPRVAVSAR